MALKKQDKNPVEIDETLQEQQYIDALVNKVSEAQKIYATYSQEQVDHIFRRVALKLSSLRIPLAKMAVEETGMGVVEDKVIKNHFASEYIYNAYRDVKTCGVIEEDKAYGITRCYYGHLHGNAIRYAVQGDVDGIRYKLVSADGLRFCPYRIN